MVSKYKLIDYLTKENYTYDELNDTLQLPNSNEKINATFFYQEYVKLSGQSFESIYCDHISLYNILKCIECETVIFTSDDSFEYEPNLKCPTCTDYKTHFKYYTKQQIEENKEIKGVIDFYLRCTEEDRKAYERYKKRGLYDWEITQKIKIYNSKKYYIKIQVTNLVFYCLKIELIKKNLETESFGTVKTSITIPITPRGIHYYLKNKIKMIVTWENV